MPSPVSAASARSLLLTLLAFCCFAGPGAALAAASSSADLAVTAPHPDDSDPATPGGIQNYTFFVSNNGPDDVEAQAVMTLGDAEELVEVSSGQGECTQTSPIVCSLGTVIAGGSAQVTAQVKFTKVSASNGPQVQVSGPDGNADPDTTNNQAGFLNPVSARQDTETNDPQISTGEWSRSQSRLKVEAAVTAYGAGEVFFEYGKTAAYGSKTKAQKVSGNREKTVKSVIGGLRMNTVYHYRAVLVAGGKTYRGKDVKARTMGKLKYALLTLKVVARHPSSVTYKGSLGGGFADAPGACAGKVIVYVYVLDGGDLLNRSTRLKGDCTYRITVPFGRKQASKYGPRGKVLTQARFQGNKAVSPVGSNPDRP